MMSGAEMNYSSVVLSPSDNEAVHRRLVGRCYALAVGPGKLLCSVRGQWRVLHSGIAMFVKDYERKGYFLRFISSVKSKKSLNTLWEYKLFRQFIYRMKTSTFHTFEAEDEYFALSFESGEDASFLHAQLSFFIKDRGDIKNQMQHNSLKNNRLLQAKPLPHVISDHVEHVCGLQGKVSCHQLYCHASNSPSPPQPPPPPPSPASPTLSSIVQLPPYSSAPIPPYSSAPIPPPPPPPPPSAPIPPPPSAPSPSPSPSPVLIPPPPPSAPIPPPPIAPIPPPPPIAPIPPPPPIAPIPPPPSIAPIPPPPPPPSAPLGSHSASSIPPPPPPLGMPDPPISAPVGREAGLPKSEMIGGNTKPCLSLAEELQQKVVKGNGKVLQTRKVHDPTSVEKADSKSNVKPFDMGELGGLLMQGKLKLRKVEPKSTLNDHPTAKEDIGSALARVLDAKRKVLSTEADDEQDFDNDDWL